MNKQGNTYTIIYIIAIVVVVGAALAITAMSLKPQQQANADADKMRQILASVHIISTNGNVKNDFEKYITRQFIVDHNGNEIPGDAFNVNIAQESKQKDVTKRQMPVFECKLSDGEIKYIIPVYGAGLWGPIWGYVSINSNGKTIYGAYFAHQGETPGLGAEIDKAAFSDQFKEKRLFINDEFKPVSVVKSGQKPLNGSDYVDGISGGTITSKGVNDMLDNCISPYKPFIEKLSDK